MAEIIPYLPLIAVAGPIIGALIGAGVTYYVVVKRKVVSFWIEDSEDLTLPLRQEQEHIIFKVGSVELLNLNRGMVHVVNNGNTPIPDFAFEIMISGGRAIILPKVTASNELLRSAVIVDGISLNGGPDTRLKVLVPFLNSGERFSLAVFFDSSTERLKVHCRIADVRARIRNGRVPEPLRDRIRDWQFIVAVAGMAAATSAFATTLISMANGTFWKQ